MASTIKTRTRKLSFRDALEKRRADLEELSIRALQIQELRFILAQTIKDPDVKFGSEQSEIPILTDEERLIVKNKMMNLIEKYFK